MRETAKLATVMVSPVGDLRVRGGLAADLRAGEEQHVRPEELVAHLASGGPEGALDQARGGVGAAVHDRAEERDPRPANGAPVQRPSSR